MTLSGGEVREWEGGYEHTHTHHVPAHTHPPYTPYTLMYVTNIKVYLPLVLWFPPVPDVSSQCRVPVSEQGTQSLA